METGSGNNRSSLNHVTNATPAIAAIMVVGTWLYYRTVHFEFLNWDDIVLLRDNPVLKDVNIENLLTILVPGRIENETLYIPVFYLSFWFDRIVFDLDSGSAHAINVALHIVNGILLFYLVNHLLGSATAAVIAGLLFIAHPVNVETVAWLMGRKDLLATFFTLFTVTFWLNRRRRPIVYTGLIVITTLFSLVSKPSMIIAPVLLLVFSFFKGEKISRTDCGILITLVSLSVFVFMLNQVGVRHMPDNIPGLVQRVVHALWLPYRWLGLVFLFAKTNALITWKTTDQMTVESIKGLIVIILIIGANVLAFRKRRRPVLLGTTLILIGFLPSLYLLISFRPFITADRYGYFPLIGVWFIAGWIAVSACRRWQPLVRLLLVVWFVASVRVTSKEIRIWNDSLTFWSAQIARSDPATAIHFENLGGAWMIVNQYEEAKQAFLQAVRLNSRSVKGHYKLGEIFLRRNQLEQSEFHFRKSHEYSPKSAQPLINLAQIMSMKGRNQEAVNLYRDVLTRDYPRKDELYVNLASQLLLLNRVDEASTACRRAETLGADHRQVLILKIWIADVRGDSQMVEKYRRRVQELGLQIPTVQE